jgi:hypothetical protein
MTPGERAVWAAAYGAAFSHLIWERDSIGPYRDHGALARDAADRASDAVSELRAMAQYREHEFHVDACEIIKEVES